MCGIESYLQIVDREKNVVNISSRLLFPRHVYHSQATDILQIHQQLERSCRPQFTYFMYCAYFKLE
jgi:hypothetical protein